MIYQLPDEIMLEHLELLHDAQNEIILTDNHEFRLELTDRYQSIRTGAKR